MALRLITAAQTYPVSLSEAKAQCRVPFDDEDDLLEIYIKAATAEAENFTGRALIDQTWDLYLDAFPDDDGRIDIPKPPLIEVSGLFYQGTAGVETELATTGYVVDTASELARIVPAYAGSWPTPVEIANAVRVRFRAGYLTDTSPQEANVPFEIKAAILLTIGTLYAHRETVIVGTNVMMMPWAAKELLRPLRVHRALA